VIAVAEPVVVGISEFSAERARRRSFAGRSTMVWVLVTSWIVVIEPWRMPMRLVDHLHHRREAVGRAGGRRDDPVRAGS
jgi:hypothetical protein